MSYSVILTDKFKKQAKKLKKKYRSLNAELADLEELLLVNPFHGISLGNNAF